MRSDQGDFTRGDKTHVGTTKVDHYKWSVKDSRGQYMAIDKNELYVDRAYQRDQNDNKVIEMARSWSWMGCGAILVALRADGSHFVFDGQHRVMAARKRSDITTLDCLVFDVEKLQDEADGFLKSNTLRKPVSMMGKFKAMIVCKDEHAVAVSDLLESLGLTIDKNKKAKCFNSLAWAVKAHARDAKAFESTVRVVSSLAGDKHYIHESMCRALFYLDLKYDALSDVRFVRRLRQIGYQELFDGVHRAVAYYKKGGEWVWQKGLLDTANKGLRNPFYIEHSQDASLE